MGRKIKNIIFDMDGVLIDAREWHYEALNQALSLFGYEISRYDHLITYDGLPTSDKLNMLTLERNLPRGLHQIINQLKQQYTLERVHQDCHPIFIHEYALSKLKANGYNIVVASNSIKSTIDLMMEKSNLKQYLNFFLSNQDVVKAKPDPEIYNLAIQKLDSNPNECVILEDNKNGIAAAKASGAYVLEVKDPYEVTYDNIINFVNRL